MVNSYEDMMGSPQDPSDHEAHNVPQASQHYAGDVLPMPGERSLGDGSNGMNPSAIEYATGSKQDSKVHSIGMDALKGWAARTSGRTDGK